MKRDLIQVLNDYKEILLIQHIDTSITNSSYKESIKIKILKVRTLLKEVKKDAIA